MNEQTQKQVDKQDQADGLCRGTLRGGLGWDGDNVWDKMAELQKQAGPRDGTASRVATNRTWKSECVQFLQTFFSSAWQVPGEQVLVGA